MIPFTNWAVSMMPMRLTFGISTTTAPMMITNVKMLLNMGASRHLNDTPASQPNASQITKAVVRGRTQAARNEAATRPMAKSASAYCPANGARARAAASALSTSMPCG